MQVTAKTLKCVFEFLLFHFKTSYILQHPTSPVSLEMGSSVSHKGATIKYAGSQERRVNFGQNTLVNTIYFWGFNSLLSGQR